MEKEGHTLESLRKLVRNLQEENRNLKQLLKEHEISYDIADVFVERVADEYDPDQGARILPLYPNTQMAKEFYGMFWGREDVFARRGKNGGYFPQCRNRWNNELCPKQRGEKKFCDEDCECKEWIPLNVDIILQHLKGGREDCTDVIGTYPLLLDSTCRFLVFDFDNHEKDSYTEDDANKDNAWKDEVDALRRICELNGIDVLVERSRSGRGAHVWIFFREAIPAGLARNFGSLLLDRGAAQVNLTSFKFYDRMYPSQDVLSKLGNLVALPLQGKALRDGNSAFVDEAWNAYPDQWAKLKSTRKISKQEVERHLNRWAEELYGAPIGAGGFTTGINQRLKPWNQNDRFCVEDVVGGCIHIVLADGVYVDALNLMPRLQNQIRCMATIDNPQFYENSRMGRSNYYHFSTIYLGQDEEGYIRIPRGLLDRLTAKCKEAGITYEVEDNRQFGRPIRVQFQGELRTEQELAVQSILRYETGILNAATAFGKTVVSAYLIAQRKVNTLILIESADLLMQWVNELEKFLVIDEAPPVYYTKTGKERVRDGVIGTLSAGKDKTTGIIDIAMVGSAYRKGEFFPNLDSYGLILMDECHHAASAQAQAVLERIKAKYVYGVSATPYRSDKLDQINYMLLGPIRHEYTAREQADALGLSRFVVPRFTRVVNISGKKLSIHEADALIAEHEDRTEQIVADVKACVAQGRTPVILTKLKRHVDKLYELLQGAADHVFMLYGNQTPKQNQEIREQMLQIPDSETVILIATGQKVGEGFNFPRLDTLMLAAPIKFDGRLIQYIGRLNRSYEGKQDVFVYDYVDSHISFYDGQYRSRLAAYKKQEYRILSGGAGEKQTADVIYDGRDYVEVFEKDLIEADQEIIISSPGLRRGRVERMLGLVRGRQEAGVSVTVITMEPETVGYGDVIELHALIDEMRNAGIAVRLLQEEGEHYAVIDRKLVWHGGADLLGPADARDNLMRVENVQAAVELLEMTVRRIEGK